MNNDYNRAVRYAIELLRSISRKGPFGGRRQAYETMELVFQELGGDEALGALKEEKASIDAQSKKSGSGRGFLGTDE